MNRTDVLARPYYHSKKLFFSFPKQILSGLF